MKQVTVLLVEEDEALRHKLAELLSAIARVKLLPPVDNLHTAREQLLAQTVDVLVLNAAMPYIGGETFVEAILRESPLPILVTARNDIASMDAAARALSDGACDTLLIPESWDTRNILAALAAELKTKLTTVVKANISTHTQGKSQRILHFKAKRVGLPLISIGGSTGSVAALKQLLAPLPTITPPILIALNVPDRLMRNVARYLNPKTEITLVEAIDGAPLQNGYAYFAPVGQCLTARRIGDELVCYLEPVARTLDTIDRLFTSVGDIAKTNAIGVLLSGSGDDGAEGLASIRKHGGYTIIQDEASSMIDDLPRAAIKHATPNQILPLGEIAKHMLDHSQIGKRRTSTTTRRGSRKA